jgi:hypothetical protein
MHENKDRIAIVFSYMSDGMAEERHRHGLIVRSI